MFIHFTIHYIQVVYHYTTLHVDVQHLRSTASVEYCVTTGSDIFVHGTYQW